MKTLVLTALCLFIVAKPVRAADADKIIGTWIVTKMDGKEPPKELSLQVTFGKDGKMVFTAKLGAKEETDEGTFTVTGNKLSATKKGKKDVDMMTIKSITGDTMVLVDDKEKKEMELKKK